jgi:putative ABC transport system permease protein
MFKTTLRSLWSHKRRLVSTALAVLLGVAFMTGTFVLSGTLDKAFNDLFADSNEGVDTVVRGEALFTSETGAGTLRAKLPLSVLDDVRAVEGVEVAEPYALSFTGAVLTKDGDALGGQGPPTIFQSWIPDETLNSFDLSEGRAPEGPGEIAMNQTAVEDGEYVLGDEVTLLTQQGREQFELVGITTYGDAGSQAGVTSVEMTVAEVQRIGGSSAEEIDNVLARSDGSVTDTELTTRVGDVLRDGATAVTGQEAADELAAEISEGFGFLSQLLLIFAGIALFVGTFIISNTFSILIAQRTRELALLRAIGASRGQVLLSVLVEAILIGLVAAAVGLVIGVLLGYGALNGLRALGLELPGETIVVAPNTVVLSLVVGVVVTVGAAIVPAIRATRVPPIAALRDVAIDRSSRSWLRAGLGVVLLALGFLLASPAFASERERDDLPTIGMGAVFILLAVLAAGPVLAKPMSRLLGGWLPAVRGVSGRLASENAKRNPGRTASTSAALAIGITLVGFITIFGASARAAVSTDVERAFTGDFIVQTPNSFGVARISPKLAPELAGIDGVAVAAPFGSFEAQATLPDGETAQLFAGAIDPTDFTQVFDARMAAGSIDDLTSGTVLVDRRTAEDRGLEVGDEVEVLFPGGGTSSFSVAALSDEPTLLGEWTFFHPDYLELSGEPLDFLIAIGVDEGADAETVRVALREAVEEYPIVALQDRDQYIGSLLNTINQFLVIIYGLLALSVFIALIGIANTLSLSIHERTRELGLLRAVGMSRAQLRSTIRWEAVVVALIGTVLGVILSIGLSWLVVRGLEPYGLGTYSIPWGQLVSVVLIAAGLGVMAALRPAHKASKLNVLDAIATE